MNEQLSLLIHLQVNVWGMNNWVIHRIVGLEKNNKKQEWEYKDNRLILKIGIKE